MTSFTRKTLRIAFAILLLGFVLGPVSSLAQSPVGAISGQGREGDVAIIRNSSSGFSRELKIGKSGRFQARNLPVASYEVVIRHADGSEETPKRVDVHIGVTARLN